MVITLLLRKSFYNREHLLPTISFISREREKFLNDRGVAIFLERDRFVRIQYSSKRRIYRHPRLALRLCDATTLWNYRQRRHRQPPAASSLGPRTLANSVRCGTDYIVPANGVYDCGILFSYTIAPHDAEPTLHRVTATLTPSISPIATGSEIPQGTL